MGTASAAAHFGISSSIMGYLARVGRAPGARKINETLWTYNIEESDRLGNDPETLRHETKIVWIRPQKAAYVEQYLATTRHRTGRPSYGYPNSTIAYAELDDTVEPDEYGGRFFRRVWRIRHSEYHPPGTLVDPRSIAVGKPSTAVQIEDTLEAANLQGARVLQSRATTPKGNSMDIIPNKTVRRILVAQAGKCAVCSTDLEMDDYEVDFENSKRRGIVCSTCRANLRKWRRIRDILEPSDTEGMIQALQYMYEWEKRDE
jgi:hypothetical protein